VTGADMAELAWTPLSDRLGVTRTAAQRAVILAALDRMDWSRDIDRQLHRLNGRALRAVVTAIHRRRDELHLVGTAALPDGRQLAGLQHFDGTRTCLLALEADGLAMAIHVLTTTVRRSDNRVA
jgi:hypothetical protein